jgi:predicted SAM-dependent methyltransferase
VGCGHHYSNDNIWVNLDFTSTGEGVQAHNLLNGIPYADNSFAVVYHSHVLEHFSKKDARIFMDECFRVLKKNGILRVVVPDLKAIIKEYQHILSEISQKPQDAYLNACYDWIMIELYDQTIRNKSGGQMVEFLAHDVLINEDFILKRCGYEVKSIIDSFRTMKSSNKNFQTTGYKIRAKKLFPYLKSIPHRLKQKMLKQLLGNEYKFYEIGKFRSEGEIHQWMYDDHSLSRLLAESGFRDIHVCNSFESNIPGWEKFSLETVDGNIRKPDSLFMEAVK